MPGTESVVDRLDRFVDHVRITSGQVNLIAHSTGGLVIAEYLLNSADPGSPGRAIDPDRATKVRQIVTLGTPFLGAVNAYSYLRYGQGRYWIWSWLDAFLNNDAVIDTFKNFPGAYGLTPMHPEFFDTYNSYIVGLSREQTIEALEQISPSLVPKAEKRQADRVDTAWSSGRGGIPAYMIVGCGQPTLRSLKDTTHRKVIDLPGAPPFEVAVGTVVARYSNGDGTVLLHSASLNKAGGFDLTGGGQTRYFDHEHGDLAKNSDILDGVVECIRDPESQILRGETTPCSTPDGWRTFLVLSPASPHVYDEQDRHTGPTEDGFDFEIPGVRYDVFGETKSVILPDQGQFRIVVEGEGEGVFDLKLITHSGDVPTETVFYSSVPTAPGAQAEVIWDDKARDFTLRLDSQGDGVFEAETQPSSILGPQESLDEDAPTIEIVSPQSGELLVGAVLVDWKVTDSNSGLLQDLGIVDPNSAQSRRVAAGDVVTLAIGTHTLSVHAEDRAGNTVFERVTFEIVEALCEGVPATIFGTDGDDEISGTPGNDVIVGLDGNDEIRGLGGNDVICGGPGDDMLIGGHGDDLLLGEAGNDRLYGQDGMDDLRGGEGNDVGYAGPDDDTLSGGDGDDRLRGEAGNDTIAGDAGNDTLVGHDGDDIMSGGPGADRLYGRNGADIMSGGDGDDSFYGGDGGDTINGDAGDDRIRGENDEDTCTGGPGVDVITTCETVFP